MGMKVAGAAALIFDGSGRILLVKHTYGPLNWELPGGGSDDGESFAGTAIRETREETGLNVEVERLIGLYYHPDRDVHDFTFLCRPLDLSEIPKPSSPEIADCAYWPIDSLPRPISDWTELRIRHGAIGETIPNIVDVPTIQWLE